MISDPPLLFDIDSIGQKVNFNQHKQESLDGFIKANEECYIILPSVYKLNQGSSDNNTGVSLIKMKSSKQNSSTNKDGYTNGKGLTEIDINQTSVIGNTKHLE